MRKVMGLLLVVGLISGCVAPRVAPSPDILRVGVSPSAQPIVFEQGGKISGVEADFAYKLGEALDRKVVFVKVPWEKQIEYLEQGRTDLIMSGMSVTAARSMRIQFASPYMRSGQSGLFRRESYSPAGLRTSIVLNQTKGIGCVKGTTSELFVLQEYPRFEKTVYSKLEAAVKALQSGKINVVIYDVPELLWYAAVNESELVAFPDILSMEPLAWGVDKSNSELLEQVNAVLAEWEKDGTRREILKRWMP